MDAGGSQRRNAHHPAHAPLPRTFYELSQVPLRIPYPRVLPAASSPPLPGSAHPPAVSVSHQPAAAPPTAHGSAEDAPAVGTGSRTASGAWWWWMGSTGPSGYAATLTAVRPFVRLVSHGFGAAAPAQPQVQQQQPQQARASPPASDITLEARVWRDVMFSDLHLTQVALDPRQEVHRASQAGQDGDAAEGAAAGRRYATAASSEPQQLLSVPVSDMYVKASLVPASAASFYSIRWIWVVDNDTCQKARLAPKPAGGTRSVPGQHVDDRSRLRNARGSVTPDDGVGIPPPPLTTAASAPAERAARGALANPGLNPGGATGAAGGATAARGSRDGTGDPDAASARPPAAPGPPPAAASDAHSGPIDVSVRPTVRPPTGPLRRFWHRAGRMFSFAADVDVQPSAPVPTAAAAPGVPPAPHAPPTSLAPAPAAAVTEDLSAAASVTCQGPAWEVGSDVDVVVQLVHRCTGERVLLRATDLSVGMEVVLRWWEVAWLMWMVLRHVMDVAFLEPLRQVGGWVRNWPQRPPGEVRGEARGGGR